MLYVDHAYSQSAQNYVFYSFVQYLRLGTQNLKFGMHTHIACALRRTFMRLFSKQFGDMHIQCNRDLYYI